MTTGGRATPRGIWRYARASGLRTGSRAAGAASRNTSPLSGTCGACVHRRRSSRVSSGRDSARCDSTSRPGNRRRRSPARGAPCASRPSPRFSCVSPTSHQRFPHSSLSSVLSDGEDAFHLLGPHVVERRLFLSDPAPNVALDIVERSLLSGDTRRERDEHREGRRHRKLHRAAPSCGVITATATSARIFALGPRDVVVQPLAVRHDGVEERDAFRAVLHRMADERNRIAGLEGGARPSLAPHDVGGPAFDVPGADGGGIDAGPGLISIVRCT